MKKTLLICFALAAAPAEAKMIFHRVQAGETLQKISMTYFGTTRKWHKLFELNKKVLATPNAVEPGMILEFDDQLAGATETAKAAPAAPEVAAGPTADAAAPVAARAPAAPAEVEEATSEPIVAPPKKERVKDSYPSKETAEASDVADGEDDSDLTPESQVTFRFGSHKFLGPDL